MQKSCQQDLQDLCIVLVTVHTCPEAKTQFIELFMDTAQWASLGVEMDKTPGGNFLDILCCK